jgi:hypothetical protein
MAHPALAGLRILVGPRRVLGRDLGFLNRFLLMLQARLIAYTKHLGASGEPALRHVMNYLRASDRRALQGPLSTLSCLWT